MSDANRTQDPDLYGPRASGAGAMWLLGLITATVVLLAAMGEPARELLRYERGAVLDDGQFWRLLTCHWVHGSWTHVALNLAGLAVIAALFPRHYSSRTWLAICLVSMVAIAVGFVWNEPQLDWYLGLSGVLHGALAAGVVAWWRLESKGWALALTAIVVGKLSWEQLSGALPISGGMPVIVDAHLYGAVGGAIASAALQMASHGWRRIVRPL